MKREQGKGPDRVHGIRKNTNGDGYSVAYTQDGCSCSESCMDEKTAEDFKKQLEERFVLEAQGVKPDEQKVCGLAYKNPMSWLRLLAEDLQAVRRDPNKKVLHLKMDASAKAARVAREFIDFSKMELKMKELNKKVETILRARRESSNYIEPPKLVRSTDK